MALVEGRPDLREVFYELNLQHFEGVLGRPDLLWNSRLRTVAGRFIPGRRLRGVGKEKLGWMWNRGLVRKPLIEIANYLCEEKNAEELVRDTMGHEMIHYWLWIRRRPYGHTSEFLKKMKEMGVSRYNTVPRNRPYRYQYRCPACFDITPARKILKNLACGACCKKHNRGQYDQRFRLELWSRAGESL